MVSRRPATSATGFQLLELVVATAALAALLAMATPPLMRWSAGLRVELAARELAAALRRARATALRLGVRVAVRLDTGGERVTWAVYRDGDGDGVLNRDIESGVDPQVVPPHTLTHLSGGVGFGFPPGPAPRDPGDPRRRLTRLQDPIRLNRSDLASFGPLGGSTPGSLYVSDRRAHLTVVRIFGRTGKVKVLRYDRRVERYRACDRACAQHGHEVGIVRSARAVNL